MSIQKTSTPVANGAIQMFEDGGLLRQSSPVEQYVLFEATSIIESASRLFKNDGGYYLPLIIFATGATYSLTIIFRRNGVTLYTATLTAAALNIGVTIPAFILSPDMEIVVTNTSAAQKIPWLQIIAKEVFVGKTIIGIA